MASTLGGQMNAMDMQVAGVYRFGIGRHERQVSALYLRFRPVPLRHEDGREDRGPARRLAEDGSDAQASFWPSSANAGIPCEIKTWNELSLFYSKVRGMFGMIFLFIFCIVLVIVVMSTVNTMGMAVLERTREIGTLRALGLKKRGVSLLFALEGGLLGLIGSFVGVVLHVVVWAVIRRFPPTYTPPGISTPVPLTVGLVPQACCTRDLPDPAFFGGGDHTGEARGRQNVVDALGHT